jgi:hypothetical protein
VTVRCYDSAHRQQATARDACFFLDAVGSALRRQIPQMRALDAERRRIAPVATHQALRLVADARLFARARHAVVIDQRGVSRSEVFFLG